MKNKLKRIFCVLLAFAMIATLSPITFSYADSADEVVITEEAHKQGQEPLAIIDEGEIEQEAGQENPRSANPDDEIVQGDSEEEEPLPQLRADEEGSDETEEQENENQGGSDEEHADSFGQSGQEKQGESILDKQDVGDTDPEQDPDEITDPEADPVQEEMATVFKQSRTVNGVVITVEAEAGAFPADANLRVERVPNYTKAEIDQAVDGERDGTVNVAVSYVFDIKVVDENGIELQPAEGKLVMVSFATAEVADTNLTTQVYHVSEENNGHLNAEKLDVQESGKTATVQTDGFSYYQVEFTYGALQYVLPGNETVELSEITNFLGLTGEITSAVSSAPGLFWVGVNDNGIWVVSALAAFDSYESLIITINGVDYIIAVTDATVYHAGSNGSYTYRQSSWFNSSRGIRTVYNSLVMNFTGITLHTMGGSVAYCFNPTKEAGSYYSGLGNGYPMDSITSNYNANVIKDLLARAMYWGYPNYYDSSQTNAKAAQAATQAMVFDILCNFITASSVGGTATKNYHHGTYGFCDPTYCFVSSHEVAQEYARLLSRMNQSVPTVGAPSFATLDGSALNYLTLTRNPSTGLYEGTWTDTTGNYQYYDFTHDYGNGLVLTQSGSTLTVTATPEVLAYYGIDGSGSTTKFMNHASNTPNRNITYSRITLYHAVNGSSGQTINWSYQQFGVYGKSSNDDSYPKAYIALKADITAGPLSLTKTSANPSLTNGRSNYSLSGAKYGIYSDMYCATLLEVITTDASGVATSASGYAPGTYYIREIVASTGYQRDMTVHAVTLDASGNMSGSTTFTEVPFTGTLQITKHSSDPAVTTGNPGYSYDAVYGLYSDSACENEVQSITLTNGTDEGTATISGLPLGTYYLKEKTASQGFQLDSTVYPVVIRSTSSTLQFVNLGTSASISDANYGQDGASNPARRRSDYVAITAGRYRFSSPGSELNGGAGYQFLVYFYDTNRTPVSSMASVIGSAWQGNMIECDVPFDGYVRFLAKRVDGAAIDSTAIVMGNFYEVSYLTTQEVLETPISGYPLSITKSSSRPAFTAGNSCYSLSGAQYGLYATSADASSNTDRLETLTTNAAGQATSINVYNPGTYYLKELSPSPGYLLDSAIHTVTIASDGTLSGNNFTEVPTDDPSLVRIRKVTNSGTTTITSSPAVFRVDFYPNNNWSGTPSATWYYKTINGVCFLRNESYLDTTRQNSPQFLDSGGSITFPLGTIRITEEVAPSGYVQSNTVLDARVSQPSTGALGEWTWVTTANGVINYEPEGATYENAHDTTTISVQKTVTGNLGDRSATFTITVHLSDPEGVPLTGSLSYTGSRSGTVILDSTGTGSFTLSHGEILTFQGIPVGSSFTFTEADYSTDGYTQASTNSSGTAAASGTTVSFTNNRTAIIQTGTELKFRDGVILLMIGAAMMSFTFLSVLIRKRERKVHSSE